MASLLRSWKHAKYFGRAPGRAVHNCRKRQPVATIPPPNELHYRMTRCCATQAIQNPETFSRDNAIDHSDQYEMNRLIDLLDASIRERQEATVHTVHKILDYLRRKDTTVQPLHALLLVRSTGRFLHRNQPSDRRSLCLQLWTLLKKKGVPLDVSHYNALLRTYSENEEYNFNPIAFVTDAKNAGIAPNKVTYQRLIDCCCRKGDIESATRLLELMKDEGLPLTTGIFSSLITGYSEAGDTEKASQIPELMKEAGLEMTGEIYSALTKAHAKAGNVAAVMETLETCRRLGTGLMSRDVIEAMHRLICNEQPNAAEKLVPYLPPNVVCGPEETEILTRIVGAVKRIDLVMAILGSFTRMSLSNIAMFYEGLFASNLPNEDKLTALSYMKRWLSDPYKLALLKTSSLQDGRLRLELLRKWRAFGAEIRPQYFFPVMVNYGRQHDVQGILETTETMVKEFHTLPCVYAVAEYIIPYGLSMHTNANDIALTLTKLNIPEIVANNAVVAYLLSNGKLRSAAKYVTDNDGLYSDELIRWRLLFKLSTSGDTVSFGKIFSKLLAQLPNCQPGETRIIDGVIISKVSADQYISRLLMPECKCSPMTVRKVAEYMRSIGCVLSAQMANALTAYIEDAGLPPLGSTLKEVGRRPGNPQTPRNRGSAHITSDEALLVRYVSENDAENAVKQLRVLLEAKHTFSMSTISRCLEFLYNSGLTDEATNFVENAINANELRIAPFVFFKAVRAIVLSGSTEDVTNFLEKNRGKVLEQRCSEHAEKFLKEVAPTCEPSDLFTYYQSLISLGYLKEPRGLRSCEKVLARALERKCTTTALKIFNELATKYRVMPKRELLARLVIEKGDVDELQHYTDAVAAVVGERDAVATLTLDFLKCGRKNEATKVARACGLLYNIRYLRRMLQNIVMKRDTTVLEGLLGIAESLGTTAPEIIYESLLDIYVATNDWQSGLALWTRMQEADVIPSAKLLSNLADLLKANLQEIPFALAPTRGT